MNFIMKIASAVVIILLIPFVQGCQPTAELPTRSSTTPPGSINSTIKSFSGHVIFPDTNLEVAVRNALFIEGMRSKDETLLEKPLVEEITVAELGELTILEAVSKNITSLHGLEYCTNLKGLYLSDNQISDISELSFLENLTTLDLGANQISDISPLASLDKLTVLDLYVNQIQDISPLASLTALNKLYLFRNQISDISPLANLNNLIEVDLYANQISDILPLLENKGLGEGDILRLAGNNLDLSEDSKNMDDIDALRDKGVVVVLE